MLDEGCSAWPRARLGGTCSWGAMWLLGSSPPPAALPFAILTLVNAPYKRGFYCGDDSIRYPYRPDTITHGLMAGVTITATVVLVRQEGLGGGRVLPWVVFVGKRAPFGVAPL